MDAHLAADLIEARQAGQGLAGAEVVERQHRVGLAATEVGLQLDHRFTALAVEALEGDAQQVAQAGGDEGAAVELAGIGVLRAADATAHLVEVGGELGLLVLAGDHIRVGGDHIAPGHQAGLHLVLDRHLVAGAVAGPLAEHLLLQFLAQGADRLCGLGRGDVAAEAGGGVEGAVGVVGGEGFLVGPAVAGVEQFTHIGAIRLAEQPLEDALPVLHEQLEQHRHVLEVGVWAAGRSCQLVPMPW